MKLAIKDHNDLEIVVMSRVTSPESRERLKKPGKLIHYLLVGERDFRSRFLFKMLRLTLRSSLVGGHLKRYISGAYRKHNIASPNSIHSKPILFTSVPLRAGPVSVQRCIIVSIKEISAVQEN